MAGLKRWLKNLKRKASRLRDWNQQSTHCRHFVAEILEKKSISITRLKPSEIRTKAGKTIPLKRKASRLRDWNARRSRCLRCATHLKRKASRLRDWNRTMLSRNCRSSLDLLEKKSISITRLKLRCHGACSLRPVRLKRKASRLRDWNRRTHLSVSNSPPSWKEKHLDYEIETRQIEIKMSICLLTWKEKHLDYEIETIGLENTPSRSGILEKKSISITRLKRRLGVLDRIRCWLEKKSISITRLKQNNKVIADLR